MILEPNPHISQRHGVAEKRENCNRKELTEHKKGTLPLLNMRNCFHYAAIMLHIRNICRIICLSPGLVPRTPGLPFGDAVSRRQGSEVSYVASPWWGELPAPLSWSKMLPPLFVRQALGRVDDNGDDKGKRLESPNRRPLSSPLS